MCPQVRTTDGREAYAPLRLSNEKTRTLCPPARPVDFSLCHSFTTLFDTAESSRIVKSRRRERKAIVRAKSRGVDLVKKHTDAHIHDAGSAEERRKNRVSRTMAFAAGRSRQKGGWTAGTGPMAALHTVYKPLHAAPLEGSLL